MNAWRHISQKLQPTNDCVFKLKIVLQCKNADGNSIIPCTTSTNNPKLIYENEVGFDMHYNNSLQACGDYIVENAIATPMAMLSYNG